MAKAPKKQDTLDVDNGNGFQEDLVAVSSLPLLAELAAATRDNNRGFLYLSDEDFNKFPTADAEFIEQNPADRNEGGIATRLGPKGLAYADEHPVEPSADYTVQSEGAGGGNGGGAGVEASNGRKRQSTGFTRPENIEIDDAVPVPTATRSARTEPAYPFDKLNVGQSFHIAATEKCPVPAKSVASSVTTAIRKYATPIKNEDGSNVIEEVAVRGKADKQPRIVMKVERKFIIRTVGKDDARGPGCRVFRVDPDQNERIYGEV